MIRREWKDAAGRSRWLLIDQAAHASLAGQLARQWQFGDAVPASIKEVLIAAIFHHDDGWDEWDRNPGCDPRGRPLNFTEMPTAASTEIWRRSVVTVSPIGPLATYAVAGHFRSLLLRFGGWRTADAAARQAAEGFIAFADAEMANSLAEWISAGPIQTPEWAEFSLHSLQTFDALSLWFCCAERTAPKDFGVPKSSLTTFVPQDPRSMIVFPWPFLPQELTLEVFGRSVSTSSAGDCSIADFDKPQSERLSWRLTAGANNLTPAANSN